MGKRIIRCTALFIVFSMIFLLSFGCAGNTGGTSDSQNTGTGTQKPTEAEKPTVLKLLVGAWRATDYKTLTTDLIQENTNTILEVSSVPFADYVTKLNVVMASSDYPDIINITQDAQELTFAEAGMLLPLNNYFDKYTNLAAVRNDTVWKAMTHKDGNIYAIPIGADPVQRCLLYRGDWLKKLSLDVPATLDEYYDVAYAVSHQDPDGNNEKDTYAIIGQLGDIAFTFDHIFAAFGVQASYWLERDGKVVNGTVMPEAKEALKFINKMYMNKLIDPEFVTDNPDRYKNKTYEGIAGAFVFFTHVIDVNNNDNHYKPFKDRNPNGEYIAGELLETPGYNKIGFRTLGGRGWLKTGVVSKSPNIDAVLRVLDYVATEEYQTIYSYGIEGEHFTVENGIVNVTADADTLASVGTNLFAIPIIRTVRYEHASMHYRDTLKKWADSALPSAIDGMLLPELNESDLLDSFTKEQYLKMIVGETPIDGGFESFVTEWNNRGGKELVDAVNREYESRKN